MVSHLNLPKLQIVRMKTVVSNTGIEVLYPCTVHLLKNGEILECEYKSDNIGRDLLDYILQNQNLSEKDYWGLRFVDTFEQRHWLELDKLIRCQVKNVCPTHFHFRVKVYPPEPYKLSDKETKHQIFTQLRYDLMSGRLCCGPNDSALLLALMLQYTHGDFDPSVLFGNYVKEKILLNQTIATETKAIDIHKDHLNGLTKEQVEDLFLRMACQLEAYGIDPYLVEGSNQVRLNLWINYNGMVTYIENRKVNHLKWMDINKVIREENKLIVSLTNDEVIEFVCLTEAECKYIYRSVADHLIFFTSSGRKSTAGALGSESIPESEEKLEDNENLEGDNKKSLNSEIDFDQKSNSFKQSYFKVSKFNILNCIFSQVYVFHIAISIFVMGAISELFSLFDKDIFGFIFLKQRITYIIKKYILSIN
ncbi:hypothetical protein NQ314_019826 [Rhamnusium bicolor]|uniref:FERM domain-containing protein n=1 Tax=Rhamnusium bicolor TaxID=1586634 RepID=A0AAV8WLN1_9CUCU|nr:hypothetical protein NQ314_019826 [Rhamnusium bicolor]